MAGDVSGQDPAKADPLVKPKPVLKWAGGKSSLLPEVLARLPRSIDTYYEPFLGGAAVFFALAAERRFERAVLADKNPELINVYSVVQRHVELLIRELSTMQHDERTYYRVREEIPPGKIRRAARTIYLNRTGYNGLYRVNRSGVFNVPFGRYKNPKVCDEARLRAASQALQHAELHVADFEHATLQAGPGDAVYFDPPYAPSSPTANFTSYHREPFGSEEQRRLVGVFKSLSERGAFTLLSNADTAETRALYRGLVMDEVQVRRPINSRASGRGQVGELLVRSAPPRRTKRQPR
ncbi:MAG: DNA adenine methylase [Polyangiaceae bacterium]|nr:DNA adenine methylase [Polyangiaceae bacterium]MCW5789305.1 DNA adenine methylase [Polyangiaceae bacterium]